MHREIKESGLAEMYKMSPVVSTKDPRAKYIGQTVRYKRSLLTENFIRSHGTIVRDFTFLIKEVQDNFYGEKVLRGYVVEVDDTFGRCIYMEDVEII